MRFRPYAHRIALALGCGVLLAAWVVSGRIFGKALGDRPKIEFPRIASQTTKEKLQSDDFKIATNVKSLPAAVLRTFQEQGGSRLLLANPGARFNSTDFMVDASVPQKRLIFVGISADACLVHYEQGGRAHFYVIEVFRLAPEGTAKPLWSAQCKRPAKDLGELRSEITNGDCN